jgi:hypothetical protein
VSVLDALCESPLGWPLEGAASKLRHAGELPSVAAIDAAFGATLGVRFVRSAPKPRRAGRRDDRPGYDAAIVLENVVPTRERNVHDLMNALVWASFPQAKRALHARQHVLVSRAGAARPGEAQRRTPEADTLAMLDEGGLLVVGRSEDEAELERTTRARDAAAVGKLVADGRARGIAFVHALYQHLVGTRAPTALGLAVVLVFERSPADVGLPEVDAALARRITDPAEFLHNARFGSIPFSPSVWQGA